MIELVAKIFWIIGFSISVVGLNLQVFIYLLVPCSRELGQKLLTQLTVARLLYTFLEYLVATVELKGVLNHIVFALYWQTDAALICWMFVFTKNLYDDVLNVYAKKFSLCMLTAIIWSVTIPIGLLCPLTMELDIWEKKEQDARRVEKDRHFKTFYDIYAYVKFFILTVNLLMFCLIFKSVIEKMDRNSKVLRSCVVFFVLVSISSVQVLVNDLLSYSVEKNSNIPIIFGAINSYQIIVITAIFVMITKNACTIREESFTKQIAKRIVNQMV